MVHFERIHCMLLTGEANYTGGLFDRGMKHSVEYCIKQQKILRECLDVLGYDEGIANDYFTYTNAILQYNSRLTEYENKTSNANN